MAHHTSLAHSSSAAVQDYAKALFALEERAGGAVATNALAERLEVTPGSASAMVRRLDELGLVEVVPYRGASLTARGRRLALEVVRHHRLLELYLAEHLDVPWDRVHGEAEILEHALSEELEEAIARKLGDPTHDPHGDPIPSRDLELPSGSTQALEDQPVGARGTFVRVSDADPEMLRWLDRRGIRPGAELEVLDRQPFGGPLTVRVAGEEHVLGGGLTRAMRVEPAA